MSNEKNNVQPITTIIFECLAGQHQLHEKTFGDKTNYSQDLYVHSGGAFPERVRVQLTDKDKPFTIGKYYLKPSAIVRGKYDKPELSPYDLADHLAPLT